MSFGLSLDWQGEFAKRVAKQGAGEGLHTAAEFVLADSRERVPLEEATLSRSGAVDIDRSALEATVSYDTVYAARQHEEMTWRHDPGRTPKYLERALTQTRAEQEEIIAASIRKALG